MNLFLSKKISYFMAVVEEGGIMQACNVLHISRTPVLKALVELEQWTGAKLFTRKNTGLETNQAGLNLYNMLLPHYMEMKRIELSLSPAPDYKKTRVLYDNTIPSMLISFINETFEVKAIKYHSSVKNDVADNDDIFSSDIVLSSCNTVADEYCVKGYSFKTLLIKPPTLNIVNGHVTLCTLGASCLAREELTELLSANFVPRPLLSGDDLIKGLVSVNCGTAAMMLPEPISKLCLIGFSIESYELKKQRYQIKIYSRNKSDLTRSAVGVIETLLTSLQ